MHARQERTETHEQAQALVAAVEEALPRWVEGSVERLVSAYRGAVDPAVAAEARLAGARAATEVGARVRQLVEADIDEQRANPLSLLRDAVRYPTQVLEGAGVPPVERDSFSVERFPDDLYDLTPASFADVDPALHEPGMAWGAAKAMAHMQRHRRQAGAP